MLATVNPVEELARIWVPPALRIKTTTHANSSGFLSLDPFPSLLQAALPPIASTPGLLPPEAVCNAFSIARQVSVRANATVPLTISVKYKTSYGESVKVVGSGAELGNWNSDEGPHLSWSDNHIWSLTADIPVGVEIRFKLIVIGPDGSSWEDGDDRTITALGADYGLKAKCAWNERHDSVEASSFPSRPSAKSLHPPILSVFIGRARLAAPTLHYFSSKIPHLALCSPLQLELLLPWQRKPSDTAGAPVDH
eukprot:gene27100-2325_t